MTSGHSMRTDDQHGKDQDTYGVSAKTFHVNDADSGEGSLTRASQVFQILTPFSLFGGP
jgi:hypothetical protein